MEKEGWLKSESSYLAWDRVQNCWYHATAQDGTSTLTSRRIQMVEGILCEEESDDNYAYDGGDDDEEHDEEHDDGDDEEDGGEASAAQYVVPAGAYHATDGLVYPLPGYYCAPDGNYYPIPR
jgi:hypothetical protein